MNCRADQQDTAAVPRRGHHKLLDAAEVDDGIERLGYFYRMSPKRLELHAQERAQIAFGALGPVWDACTKKR